eukprot:CAMPEP_0183420626 /NCGR_PEP_ID=MMETSP0370-20130417/26581_1 /TAXON_ID=268820 /ORGANISM="Peridinium aciculiferum, Strain PAER-2" /LENGTH=84 /DNA_ID=CAMNT_0025604525 /DNA_START=499 /DNA_END=753 /DNA_ORIENTATION=-
MSKESYNSVADVLARNISTSCLTLSRLDGKRRAGKVFATQPKLVTVSSKRMRTAGTPKVDSKIAVNAVFDVMLAETKSGEPGMA